MGCSSSFTRNDFIAENNKEDKLEEPLDKVKKRKSEKKKKQRMTESDEEEENEDEDTLPNNKNSGDYTNGIKYPTSVSTEFIKGVDHKYDKSRIESR